jgi:endonuclease/exonuclease/phosphatase family metal-dependent hydrolase
VKGYLLFAIILLYGLTTSKGTPLCAQIEDPGEYPGMTRGELRLMWYNVENLFFPGSDSLSGSYFSGSESKAAPISLTDRDLLNPDEEFTPEGIRRWTWKRYRAKLTALAKVIVAAGNWEPPEVVGLCEVEESRVLTDLVQHPILEPYAYDFVHKDSRDHRGMDVACLYRKDRISLVEWSTHSPDGAKHHAPDRAQHHAPDGAQDHGPDRAQNHAPDLASNSRGTVSTFPSGTRDMLHLCFSWGKQDSLDLFLVHLLSKYGGAGSTAERRKKQVEYLVHLADSVHRHRPGSLKILSGDFNESFEGYSMEPIRRARPDRDSILPIPLTGAEGSYRYRGSWSRIDLILLVGSARGYRLRGSILNISPLLTSDESYGGIKPFRSYEGYSYAGGMSDHLPLLLDISHSDISHPRSTRFRTNPPTFSRPER